ncbi:MAG: bifunctional proline dehydrogenase/L-glutamate gamma-semialdehyde dehydrogenase [Acidimicrobiales bacterium]
MSDGPVSEEPETPTAEHRLTEQAVNLSRALLTRSHTGETRTEAARRRRLGNLLEDESSRELILALTDEVMRIDEPSRAAHRFAALISKYGTGAFGPLDSVMLRVAERMAPRAPKVVMPLVKWRTKSETSGVILSADDPALARHIERRAAQGSRLNINALGEAILSDAEAQQRLNTVLSQIGRTDVNYVSVKLSSVVANLDSGAFSFSVDRVSDKLRTVYRASSPNSTFVNLDMEEYRDLELTMEAFKRVLSEPAFAHLDAGIVLQAYLPDSRQAAEDLCMWAVDRHRSSGGTIKIRLVKGANLAMERVEAELHGWIAAPFDSKADVDANFKALFDQLLDRRWADAVRIGFASHNLFDIAWAIVRSKDLGAGERVEFEMLEGMAPAQARAVQDEVGAVLMYSPVVSDQEYVSSLAYLSRRLDENTQPNNFLRSLFSLEPDSAEFGRQAEMFRRAVAARTTVDSARRRGPRPATSGFYNQPELDFTDPRTRDAISTALAGFTMPPISPIERVEDIDRIVGTASTGFETSPTAESFDQISQWLHRTADLMAGEAAETVALLATETHKTAREAAPEIAEAIDFCRYYGGPGIHDLQRLIGHGFAVSGRGPAVIVAPWNFPYAIPTGGVAAALAAGNSVILKPAPQARAIGERIVDQFHRSGTPEDRLQLVICDDGPVGKALVSHDAVETVVLTGSHDTAEMFQLWRPRLRILAETSGKNALVITASCDLDLAIADLIQSAFGHSGQKCSAASLGIVTADVYDRPTFLPRLRDAVLSLRSGPASDPATMVGPIISAPDSKLERGLTRLDPGERWLVRPEKFGPEDNRWTPGVRIGVRAGSWFHQTECFGPVLGLVRVSDLDEAIEVQNTTDFGLTGGIHSLDPDEVSQWLDGVAVGNAYVNRVITGAIVQRQPFGGWKKSAYGGGAKAGGPGYVQQLASIVNPPDSGLESAARSFRDAWQRTFTAHHDPSALEAESNILRYQPLNSVVVAHDGTDPDAMELLAQAASTAGSTLTKLNLGSATDDEVDTALDLTPDRVRIIGSVSDDLFTKCHERGIAVDTSPPSSDGFVELYRWVKEQSVSITLHRHGRVAPHTDDSILGTGSDRTGD